MANIKEIPHLEIYRPITYLPLSEKRTDPDNIVFLFSNSIDDMVNIYGNNHIKSKNKYLHYYIDYYYKGIFYKKRYFYNKKTDRNELYRENRKAFPAIKNMIKVSGGEAYNYFVDLMWWNQIIFDRMPAIELKKRPQLFVDIFNGLINDPKYSKHDKVVLINLESWNTKINRIADDPISLFYYMMYKKFDIFKQLGDVDIVFYTPSLTMRLNPSQCNKQSYIAFKRLITKMSKGFKSLELSDDDFNKAEEAQDKLIVAANNIVVKNFVGDLGNIEDASEDTSKISAMLNSKTDVAKIDEDDTPKTIEDKIIKDLSNDKEAMIKIYNEIHKTKDNKSSVSSKRDELIRKEHLEVKIDNMTIGELLKTSKDATHIISDDVSDKVETFNTNVTEIKYPNISKTYNEKLYRKDIVGALNSLSKTDIPLYIRDVKVEDSSNEMYYKETWTIQFEDTNRIRHTVKVDLPKWVDNEFMYLGGSKKQILPQMYLLPIVKTRPDEVQIVTSYNKIFIRREGNKISQGIEQFIKIFVNEDLKGVKIRRGDASSTNKNHLTSLEYDELSKNFMSIEIKSGTERNELIFSQPEVIEKLGARSKNVKEGQMCIGFSYKGDGSSKPLIVPCTPDFSLIDFILNMGSEDIKSRVLSENVGKKFTYTTATLMAKKVPLIVLMGFFEGLSTVMRKAEIEYSFSDKRPQTDMFNDYIEFKNGYLSYKKNNYIGFLMNALKNCPTKAYDFEEFDDRAVYIDLVENIYGHRNVALAFLNYYNSMIDNIAEQILESMNLPTDIVGLMIYANKLLADNSCNNETQMDIFRIRSHEVVPAILYKELATAYGRYYNTATNKKPVKVSIPRNAVLKSLVAQKTVEDTSFLNPIAVLDRMRTASPKGYIGINLDEAYTIDKRGYDKSMLGIIGMSTPTDSNCGKVRILSMNPNITDARGFVDIKNDKTREELTDANLYTAAEMLTAGAARYDDSTRTGMMTKQSGHVVPTMHSSPVLISNGAEQVVQYQLPSEFAIVAEDDGTVIEKNDKTGFIVIEYKNGNHKAIDLNTRIAKNGAGGFSLATHLNCKLNVGDKVKKNDILATDDKFFSDDLFGNRMNIGTLCKVAVFSSYSTIEDSTLVSQSAANKMASFITKEEPIVLDKNSNIDFMVNIGDEVEVNDELISHEAGYDEGELNAFLSSVGEELGEQIKAVGKQKMKTSYAGKIVDIKMYAGCEIEEMSPSLQKIFKKYYARINARKKQLEKYDDNKLIKCGVLFNEATGKIESVDGKIKGFDVGDGVLIIFYLEYKDVLGVADKVTFYSAIKSTVGDVVPEGLEPYSLYRKDEPIDFFLPSSSVLKRMAKSAPTIGMGNKVLVELKRQLVEEFLAKK